MAIGSTDYFITQAFNHAFRNSAWTSPSTVYLALFTDPPELDGTGGTEVAAGDYARKVITFNSPSGSPPAIQNSGTVSFAASAASAWGTITGFAVFDAVTNGNLLAVGDVNPSLTVEIGTPVAFAAGEITFSGAV